jgi:hypothetical protein
LSTTLLNAISLDPDQRFASAQDFLDALQHAVPSAFDSRAEHRSAQVLSALLKDRESSRHTALQAALVARQAVKSERFGEAAPLSAQSGTLVAVTAGSALGGYPAATATRPSRPAASRRVLSAAAALVLCGTAAVALWSPVGPPLQVVSPGLPVVGVPLPQVIEHEPVPSAPGPSYNLSTIESPAATTTLIDPTASYSVTRAAPRLTSAAPLAMPRPTTTTVTSGVRRKVPVPNEAETDESIFERRD